MKTKTAVNEKIHLVQLGQCCLGHGRTEKSAWKMARKYFDDLEPIDEIPVYRQGNHVDGDCVFMDGEQVRANGYCQN